MRELPDLQGGLQPGRRAGVGVSLPEKVVRTALLHDLPPTPHVFLPPYAPCPRRAILQGLWQGRRHRPAPEGWEWGTFCGYRPALSRQAKCGSQDWGRLGASSPVG